VIKIFNEPPYEPSKSNTGRQRMTDKITGEDRVYTFGYSGGIGQKMNISYPNEVNTEHKDLWNQYKEGVVHSTLARDSGDKTLSYHDVTTRDNVGNITLKESKGVYEWDLQYDDLYQLTRFEDKLVSGNVVTEYVYDFAGNRDEVKVDGAVVKDYTVSDNKIQSVTAGGETISYSYDYKGNLTSKGSDAYEWDYKNRLIGAAVGGTNITYKYSSNDLRLAKEKGGEVTYYFYNGNKLLCEKDGAGRTQKVYTHDDAGLLAMTRYVYKSDNSFSHYQPFYYTFNDMGSVVMITNRLGQVVQYYLYDPWGNVTNTENDPVNNFSFIGRYGGFKDWDTGFTQFWHRWYDSDDGRWISKDPIGIEGGMNLFGYADSVGKGPEINLYQYADNRPTYYVDSSGLYPGDPEYQPLPPIAPLPTPTLEPPTKTPDICGCTDEIRKENCLNYCRIFAGGFGGIAGVYIGGRGGWIGVAIGGTVGFVAMEIYANYKCDEICSDKNDPFYQIFGECK